MTRHFRRSGLARGWLWRIGALTAVIAVALLALPRQATPALGSAQGATPPAPVFTQGWETDRLIVQYRPGAARALVAAAAGGEDLRYVPEIDASIVRVRPGETLAGVLSALRASPHVAFVQPDFRRRISITPNDPGYGAQQWGPQKINAPAAWDVTTGSSSVIIAVIDTGVAAHGELNGRIAPGWDFVNSDDNPTDDQGHGTHVAGIAAARGNNNEGMAGLAWGARVAPYKVLDSNGSGYDSDVAAALIRALQDGAKIMNLSLGGPDASPMLTSAVNQVLQGGGVVIAAAGNESGPVGYPAAIPGVIAVSATTSSDGFASYSNFGPEVIVAAPGSSIYSTVPFGTCELCDPSGYLRLSGTSMATPHVAGLAALIWSANGGLSNTQVRQLIQTHVVDLGANGRDNQFGYGRINAGAAVQAAAGGGSPTATATATGTPCNSRYCATASPTATSGRRSPCAGSR